MSRETPTRIQHLPTLNRVVERLRDDLVGGDQDFILIYAYNGTGKTRLSMAFKEDGKRRNGGNSDTLYFNAFTEDLFSWDNDLENNLEPMLLVNPGSSLTTGFKDLSLDETIAGHFARYSSAKFEITHYSAEEVSGMVNPASPSHQLYRRFGNELETKPKHIRFKSNEGDHYIKISRGEERIFIWCVFISIIEQVLKGERAYSWVKYFYIDDPISSLDDNNAIAVASDLAKLIRKAKGRVKTVISSHHTLFYNVVWNELNIKGCRRYFLHRPGGSDEYSLRATDDTPFFHHVAMLSELKKAADSGALYTYHFNMLRSILEKTATFFGKKDFSECLEGVEDEALYSRALNLLSHGRYSLYEPVVMLDDNKQLFRDILDAFLTKHAFALPEITRETAPQPATVPDAVAAVPTTDRPA